MEREISATGPGVTREKPRYAIGIDLGTSHCALSYISLDQIQKPEVLAFVQRETESTQVESPLLPSWLYIPTKSESRALGSNYVGRYARRLGTQVPGRVVHSAKSWFVAQHVDRRSKILPWGSEDLVGSKRLSPVEVSGAFLLELKNQWEKAFPHSPFQDQYLTLTVPASFDEVAQRLTLEALATVGGTEDWVNQSKVKLLEEPQAAFYATLEKIASQSVNTVLVCDIGGGTSDFSLFKVEFEGGAQAKSKRPKFTRLSVSDHILLGGDNMDLALAKAMEKSQGLSEPLNAAAFQSLTHSVRALKEELLSDQNESSLDEVHKVAILGEGGVGRSLFKNAQSFEMTKGKMLALILDGFFPKVSKDDFPARRKTGLRQLGLPYALDPAVTRYLAEFLAPFYHSQQSDPLSHEKPMIDAVLLVGGTLKPKLLRERLVEQIGQWQGKAPLVIEADSMDLAVAQGAARYSYLRSVLDRNELRVDEGKEDHKTSNELSLIAAGYPRSVYLEAFSEKSGQSQLVCLIPKGYQGHQSQEVLIENLPLKAYVNRKARFQLWTSRLRPTDRTGDVLDFNESQKDLFDPLPPLTATLEVHQKSGSLKAPGHVVSQALIPIRLALHVAETGLLIVRCLPVGGEAAKGEKLDRFWDSDLGAGWTLDFNLRTEDGEPQENLTGEVVSSKVPPAAFEVIEGIFGKKGAAGTFPIRKLTEDLEKAFGLKRDQWSLADLRALADHLFEHHTRRSRSLAHETAWLHLTGYCLRPGYGDLTDPERCLFLLRSIENGLGYGKEKGTVEQLWILNRRIAGGLGADEQTRMLQKIMPMIRKNEATSQEIYRLAGALERADMQEKIRLGQVLVQQIIGRRPPFLEQKIWALGRLVGRSLLYAEPQHTIGPSIVATWFAELAQSFGKSEVKASTKRPTHQEKWEHLPRMAWIWSQGARFIKEEEFGREFNVDRKTRQLALDMLELCKGSKESRLCVEQYVPQDEKLKAQLFGEKLPLGLLI